jgi:hypothetical protein
MSPKPKSAPALAARVEDLERQVAELQTLRKLFMAICKITEELMPEAREAVESVAATAGLEDGPGALVLTGPWADAR